MDKELDFFYFRSKWERISYICKEKMILLKYFKI